MLDPPGSADQFIGRFVYGFALEEFYHKKQYLINMERSVAKTQELSNIKENTIKNKKIGHEIMAILSKFIFFPIVMNGSYKTELKEASKIIKQSICLYSAKNSEIANHENAGNILGEISKNSDLLVKHIIIYGATHKLPSYKNGFVYSEIFKI